MIFSTRAALVLLVGIFVSQPSIALEQNKIKRLGELANEGHAEAQYHMGMLHNNGLEGIEKSPEKAFEWFQKSAAGSDVLGAYKVGCYYAGQFGSIKTDQAKTLDYKLIAAKAGYALAQFDVGNIAAQSGDFKQALSWWKQAADQGYGPAARNVSMSYKEGKGGDRDLAMAYAYIKIGEKLDADLRKPAAQTYINGLNNQLSATERQQAEEFVSTWKMQASQVTQNASKGLRRIDLMLAEKWIAQQLPAQANK
jgi:uncharacterized protein